MFEGDWRGNIAVPFVLVELLTKVGENSWILVDMVEDGAQRDGSGVRARMDVCAETIHDIADAEAR